MRNNWLKRPLALLYLSNLIKILDHSRQERLYFLMLSNQQNQYAIWIPKVWPTTLQVLAQPLFFSESKVKAHPSTAISWVAAKK